MALIECPACGHKVSDSAASCPGCGAIRGACNELNWPTFHITAVGMLFVLAVPNFSGTLSPPARIMGTSFLAIVLGVLGWDIPAVAESRRLRRERKAAGRQR
jgi:hypothetical protein